MKVVHLAPGHARLDTRVFHKECRSLVAAGHDVTLVLSTGRERSVEQGVRIRAFDPPRSRGERFLVRPLRIMLTAWRLGADCYHVHDVEALPAGALMALRGRAAIWDSHEDFPRLAADRPWIPQPLRSAVSKGVRVIERMLVRPYDVIISAEEAGATRFPPEKTRVIRNYPLESEFPDPTDGRYGDRPLAVAYIGDITRQRGALEMVRAMELVAERVPGCRLLLAGRFGEPDLLDELRREPGWTHVDYVGFLTRGEVVEALGKARLGVVLLHPIRKYAEGAVPVKLFEYMAAGIPVVGSDLPVIREIVSPSDAGVLVDPLDPQAVSEAVTDLLTDDERAQSMGRRGRQTVLSRYTWKSENVTLQDVYRSLSR